MLPTLVILDLQGTVVAEGTGPLQFKEESILDINCCRRYLPPAHQLAVIDSQSRSIPTLTGVTSFKQKQKLLPSSMFLPQTPADNTLSRRVLDSIFGCDSREYVPDCFIQIQKKSGLVPGLASGKQSQSKMKNIERIIQSYCELYGSYPNEVTLYDDNLKVFEDLITLEFPFTMNMYWTPYGLISNTIVFDVNQDSYHTLINHVKSL